MSLYGKLRPFQKAVVDQNIELIAKVVSDQVRILDRQVTVSPTGSGKTFMMAAIIESGLSLPQEPNFVWVTHNRQILVQTQNEIVQSLGSRVTTVYNIEQGIESFGGRVLLFNVQKGVSAKAKDWLRRWAVFQKDLSRPTVFIVDEADEGMSGKNMEALRETLKPLLELGFTASFKKKDNESEFLRVKYEDVIAAGMLVERIDYQASAEVTRQELFRRAIAQRDLLERAAEHLRAVDPDRYFVPKMLIQAPARECEAVARELQNLTGLSSEQLKERVVIHTQNSRGLDEAEDLTSVRFIIGDLMVERGWNCPEAYVLLSTKDSVSEAKGIQLLGRVIRLPQAQRFDDNFEVFNRGYVYISGNHAIEDSARNFGGEDLPFLPPPREVVQVERRVGVIIPPILSFKDELDKDIEDRDLRPVTESLCEALGNLLSKAEKAEPGIRTGALNLEERAVLRNPLELVESDWNVEHAKKELINALCRHMPRNYANLVVTKFQIRMKPSGGLGQIAPYVHDMMKSIRDSSMIRRITDELDYVVEPYEWPEHKLVIARPLPSQFDRSLYPKMQLNAEEEEFAVFLDEISAKYGWYWIRNEPSDVRLFRGHAPDFIVFSDCAYVFIEYKGEHLLGNSLTIRKNEAGQAAVGYFMVYKDDSDRGYMNKGRAGECDEPFSETLLALSLSSRRTA